MIARLVAWLEASPTLEEYGGWAFVLVCTTALMWGYTVMYGAADVVAR